jgi:hypothetical protein
MTLNVVSRSRGLTLYATTPQSKFGFAPIAIGFTVFGISQVGGSSGGAFNPSRMFGPALLCGRWKYCYIYFIAQYAGAAAAAYIVHYVGSSPQPLMTAAGDGPRGSSPDRHDSEEEEDLLYQYQEVSSTETASSYLKNANKNRKKSHDEFTTSLRSKTKS